MTTRTRSLVVIATLLASSEMQGQMVHRLEGQIDDLRGIARIQ